MARSDSYASEPDYRAEVDILSGADGESIARDLLAVSRSIDSLCEVPEGTFNADDEVTTRILFGVGGRLLDLDRPIASVTDLVVKIDTDNDGSFADETPLTINTDFEPWPLNAADDGVPWTQLYLPAGSSHSSWPDGYRVQIAGYRGYLTVPAAIKTVCIAKTAILRLESPRATSRISELGQFTGTSRRAQDIIDELLSPYKRYPIAVG